MNDIPKDAVAATSTESFVEERKEVTAALVAVLAGRSQAIAYNALVEAMKESCACCPLLLADSFDVGEMLNTYDNNPIDEDDPDEVAEALLALRPDPSKLDDVTWCTHAAKLRANPQPPSWWVPHLIDGTDYLPDSVWEALSDLKKDMLEVAIEHMLARPDQFTMKPETPDEAQ